MEGVAYKPLTVGFSNSTFLAALNEENRKPFWFQLGEEEKAETGEPWGPANPQALNRYAYVLNNPLKYSDPTGHHPIFRVIQQVFIAVSRFLASFQAKSLMNELTKAGTKYSPDKLVSIARSSSGRVVFLETGSAKSGLTHILQRHASDFSRRGVAADDIPDLVMTALTKGNLIGTNKDAGIYEVVYKGVVQRLSIVVGNNGYVVTAYPAN